MALPDLQYPAKRNLVLVEGSEYRRQWQFTAGGEALPLEGYEARAQVRSEPGADEILLDLTPHLSIDDDTVTMHLGATETRDLELGDGAAWDLFLVSTIDEDDAQAVLYGSVSYKIAVTEDD